MLKHYYRRQLPHIVPPGATLFITFRLAGTLPAAILAAFGEERRAALDQLTRQTFDTGQRLAATQALHKRLFIHFDELLDDATGPRDWLRQPAVAHMVMRELRDLSEIGVQVLCYCVMPNHVHLLVQLPERENFSCVAMMQRIKGRTAVAANRLLERTGQPFWQHESYDHLVRSARETERVKAYILNNPVKAGLVGAWEEWPFSFLEE